MTPWLVFVIIDAVAVIALIIVNLYLWTRIERLEERYERDHYHTNNHRIDYTTPSSMARGGRKRPVVSKR